MAQKSKRRLRRYLPFRPRLFLAIAFGICLFLMLPTDWRGTTRTLVSWDVASVFWLILVTVMMYNSNDVDIRKRAAAEDEGGLVVLAFSVAGAVASIFAIMHELVAAKSLSGQSALQAVGLAAATVVLSWIFMQTIFALHYAHEFYGAGQDKAEGGLEFPGHLKTPDYWDFVYFSIVIGAAAATADINIQSKVIRRVVTCQCIIVFFFNTSVLALAINVGAGLLS